MTLMEKVEHNKLANILARKRYKEKETVRTRICQNAHLGYYKLRLQVVAHLGGKCSNPACGWINEDGSRGCVKEACLQIDHIAGGGVKEHAKLTPRQFYKKVPADTFNIYQLLCANCNWIKKRQNGENPKLKGGHYGIN